MGNSKRARPVCGYMGCTRDEYHAGLCSVTPPPVKRMAPMPRRLASNSMLRETSTPIIPISEDWTTDAPSDHSIEDLLFTVEEVEQLIEML